MKRFPYTLFPFRVSCWSVCTHWKSYRCLDIACQLLHSWWNFVMTYTCCNSGYLPICIGSFPRRKMVSFKFIPSEIMRFILRSRGYRREATYTHCSQDAQHERDRNSWAVVNYQGDLVTYQVAHMPDRRRSLLVLSLSSISLFFCVKFFNFVLSFSTATFFVVFAVELLYQSFCIFIVFYPFCAQLFLPIHLFQITPVSWLYGKIPTL